jgi:hypothetical protein
MNEYDLDRRQVIPSTGDNASEWMEAGADSDELIKLGLLVRPHGLHWALQAELFRDINQICWLIIRAG